MAKRSSRRWSGGENDISWDAGIYRPAAIGNFVWNDTNANGVQDAGELGISGVRVKLFNCSGVELMSALTDGSGEYSFTNLKPGEYHVEVIKPAGYYFSPQDQGFDGIDSDVNAAGIMACTTLVSGEIDYTWDAGLFKPAALGNFVWEDLDEDGVQDQNEPGVPNVTVSLTDCAGNSVTDLSGIVVAPMATDSNGFYQFTNLKPGQYRVTVTLPSGYQFTLQYQGGNTQLDSNVDVNSGKSECVTLAAGTSDQTIDVGLVGVCIPGVIGGVDLQGIVDNFLFFFADGSVDANWQGASKGFVGNVVVDGILAKERTSGGVPYAGTIYTSDTTLSAWQNIINQNVGQAFASYGNVAAVAAMKAKLEAAFAQINAMPVTPGYASVSATSLNGLNTQNGVAEKFVINITSGANGISSKINIKGDADDVFILRWDTDANFANGYQGTVKFQSGGAIVPLGGLTPGNFIHVAGNLSSSGGGSTPPPPYPQGPRFNDGQGALVAKGDDFNGGGFFTGYWLTTGDPGKRETSPLSNAIFVGGWYTTSVKFSLTSGTSGVYVTPPCIP
jgi:hypothetical protein